MDNETKEVKLNQRHKQPKLQKTQQVTKKSNTKMNSGEKTHGRQG